MSDEQCIAVGSDLDIVAARVEARNLARDIGFGLIDQARIATAISELARNIVLYAGHGLVVFRRIARADGREGLEIVCQDQGPGIEDVDRVMHDGYSTTHGLGMGLPGTKRLMDEFVIESAVGVGTTVMVRKWLR